MCRWVRLCRGCIPDGVADSIAIQRFERRAFPQHGGQFRRWRSSVQIHVYRSMLYVTTSFPDFRDTGPSDLPARSRRRADRSHDQPGEIGTDLNPIVSQRSRSCTLAYDLLVYRRQLCSAAREPLPSGCNLMAPGRAHSRVPETDAGLQKSVIAWRISFCSIPLRPRGKPIQC